MSEPAGPVSEGTPGGRLFVVATPIGNLADITLRALDTLRSVPLIAAEDTRVTRRLLVRHGLDTPLTSFRAANARERLPELLAHLAAGDDLAIVTDAGTPGVSDPGAELAAAWGAAGGAVVPIPGPSAALAAVAASGIAGPRWSFEGFLPRSGRERRERLDRLAVDERGTVLFEAPSRLAGTLVDLAERCLEPCKEFSQCRAVLFHRLPHERRFGLGVQTAQRWVAGELSIELVEDFERGFELGGREQPSRCLETAV